MATKAPRRDDGAATPRRAGACRRFTGAALALCLAAWVAQGAEVPRALPESHGMSAERLDRVRAEMDRLVESGEFPGMSALIARRGAVVFEHVTGLLDLEAGTELASDSLLRIYSMTKPITSVAALMLVEDGKLLLDAPVTQFFPEWEGMTALTASGQVAPVAAPVTARQLLMHTSGLSYGYYGNAIVDRLYRQARLIDDWDYLVRDTRELVEKMADLPLLFQPGERWHYGFSSDVLGHLVERVSGTPLDRFMQDRLFRPLGMNDAYFDVPPEVVERFGTNHIMGENGRLIVQDGPGEDPEFIGVTFLSGGGGLVMTVENYLRFCLMMANGGELDGARVLSPTTVALMTSNLLPAGQTTDAGDGFGLGFAVAPAGANQGILTPGSYYWGGAAGTFFWIDPAEQLIGVFMPQRIGTPSWIQETLTNLTYAAITASYR